jgi:hypothetical protein
MNKKRNAEHGKESCETFKDVNSVSLPKARSARKANTNRRRNGRTREKKL